jgi:hypothetical protein
LPVNQGGGWWGLAQGESFNERLEFGLQSVSLSPVPARAPGQSGEALAPIPGQPALSGPQLDPLMTGDVGQGHAVFHTRP